MALSRSPEAARPRWGPSVWPEGRVHGVTEGDRWAGFTLDSLHLTFRPAAPQHRLQLAWLPGEHYTQGGLGSRQAQPSSTPIPAWL